MFGLVYRISFPNGKCYVGITTRTIDARLAGHLKAARSKSSLVGRAISKFGAHRITVEVVRECADKAELLAEEKRFIAQFNSKHPTGYNLTDGGEGAEGYEYTEEDRRKISTGISEQERLARAERMRARNKENGNPNKGEKAWNKGLATPEETRAKISLSLKGVQKTELHKLNISLSKRNK